MEDKNLMKIGTKILRERVIDRATMVWRTRNAYHMAELWSEIRITESAFRDATNILVKTGIEQEHCGCCFSWKSRYPVL